MKFCLLSTLPSRCKCGQAAPALAGVFFEPNVFTVYIASEETTVLSVMLPSSAFSTCTSCSRTA